MRYAGRCCLLAAILALAGCSKSARHSASKNDAAKASESEQALANDTAFELVATANGATLLWAPRERHAAALLALALGPDGATRGAPTTLVKPADAPGEISDLAAAFGKGELAAAWVERKAGRARVRAAVQSPGLPTRIVELGPAWFAPRPARGNLGIARQGQATLVFARGESSACVDRADEDCFGFAMRKLQPGPVDRGFPLIVPRPCAESSITLAVTGRDLHYAVCTNSNGKPRTTLFTIRAEPEYARADPLLPGCRPLALVELGGSVRLVADCEGHRRAARVGGSENSAVELEDLPSPALECQGERARIRFGEAWFELDAPLGQLQALLPTVVAPRGSRAAFTGAALLVAQAKIRQLELSRYACRAGILRQLSDAPH